MPARWGHSHPASGDGDSGLVVVRSFFGTWRRTNSSSAVTGDFVQTPSGIKVFVGTDGEGKPWLVSERTWNKSEKRLLEELASHRRHSMTVKKNSRKGKGKSNGSRGISAKKWREIEAPYAERLLLAHEPQYTPSSRAYRRGEDEEEDERLQPKPPRMWASRNSASPWMWAAAGVGVIAVGYLAWRSFSRSESSALPGEGFVPSEPVSDELFTTQTSYTPPPLTPEDKPKPAVATKPVQPTSSTMTRPGLSATDQKKLISLKSSYEKALSAGNTARAAKLLAEIRSLEAAA